MRGIHHIRPRAVGHAHLSCFRWIHGRGFAAVQEECFRQGRIGLRRDVLPVVMKRSRRDLALGAPRYDEDVFQNFDERMDRIRVHYIDEPGEKHPDQRKGRGCSSREPQQDQSERPRSLDQCLLDYLWSNSGWITPCAAMVRSCLST